MSAPYVPTQGDLAAEAVMLPLVRAAIDSGARVTWCVARRRRTGRAVALVTAGEAVTVPDEYAGASVTARRYADRASPVARVLVAVDGEGSCVRRYAPAVKSVGVVAMGRRRVVA